MRFGLRRPGCREVDGRRGCAHLSPQVARYSRLRSVPLCLNVRYAGPACVKRVELRRPLSHRDPTTYCEASRCGTAATCGQAPHPTVRQAREARQSIPCDWSSRRPRWSVEAMRQSADRRQRQPQSNLLVAGAGHSFVRVDRRTPQLRHPLRVETAMGRQTLRYLRHWTPRTRVSPTLGRLVSNVIRCAP